MPIAQDKQVRLLAQDDSHFSMIRYFLSDPSPELEMEVA